MEPFGAFIGIGLMVAIIYLSKGYAHKISGGRVAAPRASTRVKARGRKRKRSKYIDADLIERQLELEGLRLEERRAARETFEKLINEKLDVIKLAVSMGYEQQELKALDRRLEEIVGKDQLAAMLNEDIKVPTLTVDLMDDDLQAEIDRLAELQQA